MPVLLDAALAYLNAGLSVIPTRSATDAERPKAPALASWKAFQRERAEPAVARTWFPRYGALAVVCGKVSYNLEIIDFDDADAYDAWQMIVDHELPELFATLVIVGTPSGGRHVYYRVMRGIEVQGNTKLALDMITVDGPGEHLWHDKTYKARAHEDGWIITPTLIETRGEGGYALAPPTPGYTFLQGDLSILDEIDENDRDLLLDAARSLDLYAPARAAQAALASAPTARVEGDPGSDFNQRGWDECAALLTDAGWRLIRRLSNGHEFWCRPGKAAGVSATYNAPDCPGRFYVFSSNAGLDVRAYDAFGLYARLAHQGDFAAATRDLLGRGYGTATRRSAPGPTVTIGGAPARRSSSTATGDGQAGDAPVLDEEYAGPYFEADGRIFYQGAKEAKAIADFTARIVRQVTTEEGMRVYTLRGRGVRGGAFEVEIGATQYEDAPRLAAALGGAAGGRDAIHAGQGKHLPAAVKMLTGQGGEAVEHVRRFSRVGWADVAGAGRVYLAPGREPVGVEVRVSKRLPVSLPTETGDLQEAQDALRSLVESLGPGLTTIVLAHILAAPAARADGAAMFADERYALMIVGQTGSLKTSFTQAALTLFGEGFARDEALLRWGEGATANALMQHATSASDAPFFIDNFKPNTGGGSRAWVSLVHSLVEGGEKERLGRDAHLREARTVDAWPIFTGEDTPDTDAAATARTLIVRFPSSGGRINEPLAHAQASAALLPLLGAAYIAWLETDAGRAEAAKVGPEVRERRGVWAALLRATRPDMGNILRVATSLALNEACYRLACSCPVLAPVLQDYARDHEAGLEDVATGMAHAGAESLEALRLFAALEEMLASGRAQLAERGRAIIQSQQSTVVGFTDHLVPGVVYLLVDRAIETARRMLGDERAPVISKTALYAQVERLGLLATRGGTDSTIRIRVGDPVLGGTQQVRVLALRASALHQGDDADAAVAVESEDLPF